MEQKVRTLYAHVIIKLLQGPVYYDDKNGWRDLMSYQSSIQEFFSRIGIEFLINETDGFARIYQPEAEDNEENPLPRLQRKQVMTYEATLLSVILREILEEFDVRNDSSKLYLTQKEIKERIEVFFNDQSNKSRLWKDLSKPINSLVSIGILKLNREDTNNKENNQYEVKRIIKALVSNDKLDEVKKKLQKNVNPIQH